ncbi:MAG: hypothetical protein O3B31_10580 [Chloroflexi bacterium]|nr:hypothetical protein [Chloroflexota bacterium]MDA1003773.1 hypothetical protein [Chloroflexota bacterium]
MLGILLGGDEGLLEVIPGSAPERVIADQAFTSLDYRAGVALAGAPGAGAWVHTGKRWEQCLEGAVHAVRVAPDGRLYAGLEPAAVFVSSDRGVTWREFESVRHIVRHNRFATPAGHDAPFIADFAFPKEGLLLAITGGGVWHTHDDGRSWLRRGDGLDVSVHALLEHPEQRDRMFATADSGVFRSEDAGFSWLQSLGGLDRSWGGGLAIVPGAPDRLVLSASRHAHGVDGALFRSANGGVTWSRVMLEQEDEWPLAPVVTRVWDSEDTLFAAAGDKLWGSHDGGRQWLALAEDLPTSRAIAAAL